MHITYPHCLWAMWYLAMCSTVIGEQLLSLYCGCKTQKKKSGKFQSQQLLLAMCTRLVRLDFVAIETIIVPRRSNCHMLKQDQRDYVSQTSCMYFSPDFFFSFVIETNLVESNVLHMYT